MPENLCAKIPEQVSDEAAAFTVIGAIALQGIRLAQPTLGEAFVVTGLGCDRFDGGAALAVAWLPRAGHRPRRPEVRAGAALRRGNGRSITRRRSCRRGGDFFPATRARRRAHYRSTSSNEPVHQGAQMCRKRGRIVLVGVVGLELSRADFYEKELSFQVSCCYGPGRYDPNYEERGQDYPIGLVRWTEQRNFEAVLDMLAEERLDVSPLVSHRFSLDQAEQAYRLITSEEPSLGIIIQYPAEAAQPDNRLRTQTIALPPPRIQRAVSAPAVSFIGAGNYATQVLIPAFRKAGVRLDSIASRTGVSSVHTGRKYGFAQATTDIARLLADPKIDAVVIATRHNSHAQLVCDALKAGKHVFVEKPLALSREELAEIETVYESLRTQGANRLLMVGFNRRFAPQVQKIKKLLIGVQEPKSFVMTVNAGAIPA